MHKLYSIVLLTVFLAYTCSQNMIILLYLSDVQGYTEKYCVNIDKPELECNGMCHLTDKLAKETQEQEPEQLPNLPTINLYIISEMWVAEEVFPSQSETKNNFHYNESLIGRNTVPLSPPPII